MAHYRKSFRSIIKQRIERYEAKTVSLTARPNPHQASCQGLSVRYWWPKITASVIVKPPKRKALTEREKHIKSAWRIPGRIVLMRPRVTN